MGFDHYENLSMQYTKIFFFSDVKMKISPENVWYFFFFFAQNIDRGYKLENRLRYALEPPPRLDSNEYPQSMSLIKIPTFCVFDQK